MAIKKLSVKLLNQIAAGEVVERPASVVKELLENAIDSKASRIVLKVENAGKSLILVTDNGCGIDENELELALEAHATSKIATTEDLACINTLGFRGEALASISSVSKLCLTSRTKDSETAHAIYAQGLEKDNTIYPAAHPVGTSVEVCELFFNTPARRRFLKSDKTESFHIRDVFVKTALANPSIQFEFINDEKRMLFVKEVEKSTKENLANRIASLIGSEFTQSLYSACNTQALSVEGFILPPPESEADCASDLIYIFLNSRVIADRVLMHAIRQAYITVYGRSCPCRVVLYLRCDPKDVDVNVHPRKDEVRFHEQRLVHDTLLETLAATLLEYENLSSRQHQSDIFEGSDCLSDTQSADDNNHVHPSSDLFVPSADNVLVSASDKAETPDSHVIGRDDLSFLNSNNIVAASDSTKVFNLNDFVQKADESTAVTTDSLSGAAGRDNERSFSSNSNGTKLSPASNAMHASRQVSCGKTVEFASAYERQMQQTQHKDFIDLAPIQVQSLNISGIKGLFYYGTVLSQVFFVRYDSAYYLIKIKDFILSYRAYEYTLLFRINNIDRHALTMPFEFRVDRDLLKKLKLMNFNFERLGFEIAFKTMSVVIKAVPKALKEMPLNSSMLTILQLFSDYQSNLQNSECPYALAKKMFECTDNMTFNENQLLDILQKCSFADFFKLLNPGSVKEVDIATLALELLNSKDS